MMHQADSMDSNPAYLFGKITSQLDTLFREVRGIAERFRDVEQDIDGLGKRVKKLEDADLERIAVARQNERLLKATVALGGSGIVGALSTAAYWAWSHLVKP